MTSTIYRADLDQRKLDDFMGKAIGDLSSTLSAALTVIGDRLGLYRSLAAAGPSTVEELAEASGAAEAYLRPWTANQAAGGYLSYDDSTERFFLTAEQTAALADEDSPNFFPGAIQLALATIRSLPQIEERFSTGEGFGWHEHDRDLFVGTERFFRPGYAVDLVPTWLPAMDGVVPTLARGAVVADVGAGHGASTILMAQAFPNSTFVGSDYHEASVVVARRRAEAAGVGDRVSFETHDATDLPEGAYDLVTMFDCLHDMGDPVAAARAVRASLRPGGVFLLVEPAAGDRLVDNLNPLGRLFYAASTMVCTPASLAQPGGVALGPQAGPALLTNVLTEAGFTDVSVIHRSPVNLVFQARSIPSTTTSQGDVMTTTTPDLNTLQQAIETRDAAGVIAWYTDDAVVTLVDRDHPPANPTILTGTTEISSYYTDICGRNIDHRLDHIVADATGWPTCNCAGTPTEQGSPAPRSRNSAVAGSAGRPSSRPGTAERSARRRLTVNHIRAHGRSHRDVDTRRLDREHPTPPGVAPRLPGAERGNTGSESRCSAARGHRWRERPWPLATRSSTPPRMPPAR